MALAYTLYEAIELVNDRKTYSLRSSLKLYIKYYSRSGSRGVVFIPHSNLDIRGSPEPTRLKYINKILPSRLVVYSTV